MYLQKPLKANKCEQDLTDVGGLKMVGACDECRDPRGAEGGLQPAGTREPQPQEQGTECLPTTGMARKQISSSIFLPPGKNSDC